MKKFLIWTLIILSIFNASAQDQWSRDKEILSPRENIYELNSGTFHQTVMKGRKVALFYPVTVTELVIPYYPMKIFFDSDDQDPIRKIIFEMTKTVSPFKTMQEVYAWLGLHDFPRVPQPQTPNPLPELSSSEMTLPMGATLMEKDGAEVMTFGCATCHSANLFGVKVLGLTNRFPRANEFFREGKRLIPYINTFIFKNVLQTTEEERLIMAHSKGIMKHVGVKRPAVLGLDTSLAQVALSLAKRKQDDYATKTELSYRFPRKNKLETMIADSKPAVWWNLKYKNRWLSDGSIVSGNPVHTNFLWNEIGRGADLKKLETWLIENKSTIEALTAAVFASKSPRYEKFMGIEAIDLERAKRGQAHYIQSCQKCHGTYEKGWDAENSSTLSKLELIQTTKTTYHKKTPIKDVGTDPGRYLGMKEFAEDLNRLQISKSIGTIVEPQKGYVPPPLDGIWARWPYFHNNSIPNLCALLTKGSKRPVSFYMGEAKDKSLDFDQNCVGYPLAEKTPTSWKKNSDYFYDTRKEGLSNQGHDERIFLNNGEEIYSVEQKLELIEFLKTL